MLINILYYTINPENLCVIFKIVTVNTFNKGKVILDNLIIT